MGSWPWQPLPAPPNQVTDSTSYQWCSPFSTRPDPLFCVPRTGSSTFWVVLGRGKLVPTGVKQTDSSIPP